MDATHPKVSSSLFEKGGGGGTTSALESPDLLEMEARMRYQIIHWNSTFCSEDPIGAWGNTEGDMINYFKRTRKYKEHCKDFTLKKGENVQFLRDQGSMTPKKCTKEIVK